METYEVVLQQWHYVPSSALVPRLLFKASAASLLCSNIDTDPLNWSFNPLLKSSVVVLMRGKQSLGGLNREFTPESCSITTYTLRQSPQRQSSDTHGKAWLEESNMTSKPSCCIFSSQLPMRTLTDSHCQQKVLVLINVFLVSFQSFQWQQLAHLVLKRKKKWLV